MDRRQTDLPRLVHRSQSPSRRNRLRKTPSKQFWEKFDSKYPGKVFTVLPDNALARKKAAKTPKGAVQGVRAAKSYEQAKAECERGR